MDERLFRVGIAVNELYKYGRATVLIGESFQAVGDVLDVLNIEYKFEALNENYNTIFLKDNLL